MQLTEFRYRAAWRSKSLVPSPNLRDSDACPLPKYSDMRANKMYKTQQGHFLTTSGRTWLDSSSICWLDAAPAASFFFTAPVVPAPILFGGVELVVRGGTLETAWIAKRTIENNVNLDVTCHRIERLFNKREARQLALLGIVALLCMFRVSAFCSFCAFSFVKLNTKLTVKWYMRETINS